MGKRVDASASSREHLQRRNRNPALLSASAHRHFLPSLKAPNGRIDLGGTDKAQYAEIVRVDNHAKEARNAVAGDKRRACTNPVFDKEAQQLQQDFTRMPPRF